MFTRIHTPEYTHTHCERKQGTLIQGHQNNHQVKTVRKNLRTKSKYTMRNNKEKKHQFSDNYIYIRNQIKATNSGSFEDNGKATITQIFANSIIRP